MMGRQLIQSHHELDAYKLAAMQIFEVSTKFPKEERYSGQYDREARAVADDEED